jgi:enterochelin esterase family protein
MLLRTTIVAALLTLLLPAQTRPREGRGGGTPPRLEHLTFQERSFQSTALGRTVNYGVFLPKDYDAPEQKERRYPLLLWLHGMFEDHRRFAVRGGAGVLDRMVGSGDLPPMVFVTANGDRASFYVNGKDTEAYEDLIVKDLLAQVAASYRVAESREQRAILGVSMGGFGALKIALKHPALFGTVAAHSAAILPPDPDNLGPRFKRMLESDFGKRMGLDRIYGNPIDKAKWRAENPIALVETIDKEQLRGLQIYFDCGSADRYEFDETNLALHEALDKRGIAHTWKLVDGGGHGWESGYNGKCLPESLSFVARALSAKAGRAGLEGLLAPVGEGGKDDGRQAPASRPAPKDR